MTSAHRSGCPINLSLEVFGGRRHFRALLKESQEEIYSLTEPSIELVLNMAALGTWGRKSGGRTVL
jgi:hypothetical protein